LILETSAAVLVLLIVTGYILYRLIIKKGFLPPVGKGGWPEVRAWRDKHRKKFNIIITLVMLGIVIPGNVVLTVPYLRDFKYIISREYPQFEGEIVNEVIRSKGRAKTEKIVIQNGQETLEINVDVGSENKGDFISVQYLPHLGMGVVVK